MPEVGPALAARVHAQLLRRGIEIRVGATITSAHGGTVVLAGGPTFTTDTIVVAAGSVPNPLLERTDLPLDPRGRVRCATTLQVRDRAHVFTAGDCAAVPDVTVPVPRDGEPITTAPTAQHAVRQARLLARNVDAFLAGRLLRGYRHKNSGAVAGLGRRRGAAQIGPLRMTGWPAFLLHRTYHLWAMPTADRTVRIALDWLVSGLLGRDLVAVGRRDAAPLPDTDAPPTVVPPAEVEEEVAGPQTPLATSTDLPTGATPVPAPAPTWGADPAVTGPRPATPAPPPARGSATDSQGIPAMQIAAAQSGGFPAVREPHPSYPPFAEPFPAGSFSPDLSSESTFRDLTPSLSFGAPTDTGSFREPHPSFPATPRDDERADDGPRAPYPSTSRPRHSLRTDHRAN
jgi:NADH dehydrogenase